MKRIKRFNESNSNSINSIKDEILDLLIDSFLDNDIPVDVNILDAYIKPGLELDRQYIYVKIGNSDNNRKESEYISLKDKVDDLKRLINWAKTENLIFKKMSIFDFLNVEKDISIKLQKDIFHKDIMGWFRWFEKTSPNLATAGGSEKFGFIQLVFENYGWQTSHHNYTSPQYGSFDPMKSTKIDNQIIQEYTFTDMNQMTNFISSSMKVFENNNHHPHYFHWNSNKLIIALKTHSSDSVTEKDWIVANQLDNLV